MSVLGRSHTLPQYGHARPSSAGAPSRRAVRAADSMSWYVSAAASVCPLGASTANCEGRGAGAGGGAGVAKRWGWYCWCGGYPGGGAYACGAGRAGWG